MPGPDDAAPSAAERPTDMELSILDEIAAAISSTLSTEKINQLIVERLIQRMDAEQGYITLLMDGDIVDTHTVARVIDDGGAGLPIRLGLGLTAWLIEKEEPLLANDAQEDPRFRGVGIEGQPIRSVLAVPLMVRRRMIGFAALFNKRTGRFTDQDARLLGIVAAHAAQVLEAARLYEQERQLARLEDDLRAARSIQANLLPRNAPEIEGFELAGSSRPARTVGGDYYDFIQLPAGRMGIVLGDVSGKGLPAAMLMANLQATLRGQALACPEPADCVSRANRLLHQCVEPGKFVTLFYGLLEPAEQRLTYCSAGHLPPILLRADGRLERPDKGGLVLGVLGDFPFQEGELELEAGDLLVLFSDGVTEARDAEGQEFEEDRLIRCLRGSAGLSAQQVVDRVVHAVEAFQCADCLFDDLTVVALRRA